MVSLDDIQELSLKIAGSFDTEKIVLFGSYASGNATQDSDVDLLVVADIDLPPAQKYNAVRKVADNVPAAFDIIVRSRSEYNHWKTVLNNIVYFADKYGKVIYDRSAQR